MQQGLGQCVRRRHLVGAGSEEVVPDHRELVRQRHRRVQPGQRDRRAGHLGKDRREVEDGVRSTGERPDRSGPAAGLEIASPADEQRQLAPEHLDDPRLHRLTLPEQKPAPD